ncbi:Fur family transcriptional regulator [Vulgatibacter sp.]|uniref:Fur family transcriptional regulator n=1 Tax=Vulgatibacter sp. TaxID=1971226 RepID=UPI0035626DDF
MATRSSPPPSTDRETLRERIREAGLRSTAPRVAVLACLEQAKTPMSHAEICDALQEEGFDRATLYRNLVDLAEVGILTRSDLGDHVWRFEIRKNGNGGAKHEVEHPHFTCTDCGEVSCLPEVQVKVKGAGSVPKSVAAATVQVQLRGRCDDCS